MYRHVGGKRQFMTMQRFLTALLILMMGIAIMPFDSVSAASCSGSGCNGLDPQATGCATGAITVETKTITQNGSSIKVELRWSSTCQTNWSRVTNTSSGSRYMKAYMNQQWVGEIYPAYGSGSNGAVIWTPMKYAPTGQIYISACGFLSTVQGSDYGAGVCTGYH